MDEGLRKTSTQSHWSNHHAAVLGKETKGLGATFLLCLIFGCFGAHCFYTGKILTGLLQLLTLGGLGVWVLIDLICILRGSFRDSEGRPLF